MRPWERPLKEAPRAITEAALIGINKLRQDAQIDHDGTQQFCNNVSTGMIMCPAREKTKLPTPKWRVVLGKIAPILFFQLWLLVACIDLAWKHQMWWLALPVSVTLFIIAFLAYAAWRES